MSATTGYRIEERVKLPDGAEVVYDAIETWNREPLTREVGLAIIDREIRGAVRPVGDYAPDGEYRLVLLGPDRTRLPENADEAATWSGMDAATRAFDAALGCLNAACDTYRQGGAR